MVEGEGREETLSRWCPEEGEEGYGDLISFLQCRIRKKMKKSYFVRTTDLYISWKFAENFMLRNFFLMFGCNGKV